MCNPPQKPEKAIALANDITLPLLEVEEMCRSVSSSGLAVPAGRKAFDMDLSDNA